MSKSELACVYACLALHDDGVEITVSWGRSWGQRCSGGGAAAVHAPSCARPGRPAGRPPAPRPLLLQADNILALTKAAGVEVEPYWPGLFAKLVEKKSIEDFIVNVGAGERTIGCGGGEAGSIWTAGRGMRTTCGRQRCGGGPSDQQCCSKLLAYSLAER